MLSRRRFLVGSAAAGAGLYLASRTMPVRYVRAVGSLDPAGIAKFQLPLVIPPAMPRTAQIGTNGSQTDYYEIAVRQFTQRILPPGLPETTVWGYGSVDHPGTFNYPSFTIEARWQTPVRVRWINDLVDADGRFRPHLLPVDPTLHWANPPGGEEGRDHRPTFTATPGLYRGPVPMVTHLHGAVGVGDESDGYAEAWFLPGATDIPAGYARAGTWYDTFKEDFFAERAVGHASDAWVPGSATFEYPNDQRAATLWYHDHTLGMTRVNVYAGPAGFYLLRGGPADALVDTRHGRPAILPGPAPALGDAAGIEYHEIPIAVQDRSFDADGSLFYPDTRAFFDGVAGPYIPDSDIAPIWNPEFFGTTIVVNGRTWPYQVVERRRYRLRILNGCDSRFLILDFSSIPRVEVWQIGNEGGFLSAPVDLMSVAGGRVLLGPAERADVIVDFTKVPLGSHVLTNLGPDEPFGGGEPGEDFSPSDPATTGQVLEFRVVHRKGSDRTTPPRFLGLPAHTPLAGGVRRPLALLEAMSMDFEDAPAEALLGRVVDGAPVADMWHEAITENPQVGDTEVWEFHNLTADAHPIHIHEVVFDVVDRQGLELEDDDEVALPLRTVGEPRGPEPWERGPKETVVAYPGEVTRVRARFDTPGLFVWHCHIVEHEDNEMMRPYAIGEVPTPRLG